MRLASSVGIHGVVAGIAPGLLAGLLAGLVTALAGPARAGTVAGKLELPPAPARGPVIAKGFVDRVENPLAEVRKPSLAPYLAVVLEGDQKPDAAPAQVNWDLVGESFARPVIAVPVGAEVVIKNQSKIPRTIAAAEDPRLITGPLNPAGTKSFRATQPAIYTIGDQDAPYLKGKIVVVATPYVAGVDDGGRFELPDVPEGTYKLRVFYYDPIGEAHGKRSDWLAFSLDVTVPPKTKAIRTEVTAKLPAPDRSAQAPQPLQAAPGKQ